MPPDCDWTSSNVGGEQPSQTKKRKAKNYHQNSKQCQMEKMIRDYKKVLLLSQYVFMQVDVAVFMQVDFAISSSVLD